MSYTFGQLETIAIKGGFSKREAAMAAAVAMAESSGNPKATNHNSNGSTDYGLWQINSIHTDLLHGKDWSNPVDNARMAHTLYAAQGWRPWVGYTNGHATQILHEHRGVRPVTPNAQNAGFFSDLGDWMLGGLSKDAGIPKKDFKKSLGANLGPLTALASLGDFFSLLLDPKFWIRVLWGFAGLVCIIIGIVLMVGSSKIVKGAVSTASKAIPGAKAASIVEEATE